MSSSSSTMTDRAQENKEAIETAIKLKAEGNSLFKEGKFQEALAKYGKIPLWIDGLTPLNGWTPPPSDEKTPPPPPIGEEKEIRDLRVAAYCNCATCYLKLFKYTEAMHFCNKALSIDNQSARALWRRGQAHLALRRFDDAEKDLRAAEKTFSTDPLLLADLKLVEENMKQYNTKAREHWAGMFNSSSGSTSTVAARTTE